MSDSKQLARIDQLCKDLGIRGNMRKLLILFGENGEATMDEIVDCLYADDPEGGPLDAEGTIRTMVTRLRKRLKGKVEIPRATGYKLKILDRKN